jgi:uncharacterized protein YkwD
MHARVTLSQRSNLKSVPAHLADNEPPPFASNRAGLSARALLRVELSLHLPSRAGSNISAKERVMIRFRTSARKMVVVFVLALVLGSCAAVQRAASGRVAERNQPAPFAVSNAERYLITRINEFRGANGLQPDAPSSLLIAKARWWSNEMASGACGRGEDGAPTLCHSTTVAPLASRISVPWSWLGENVGVASEPIIGAIQTAFENSPEHRANTLSPHSDYVGVGVAYWHSYVYVTEEFMAQ